MTGNRGLLLIIVVLLGIVVFFVAQDHRKTPGEKIADSVNETVEEIGDEIDDHTTTK